MSNLIIFDDDNWQGLLPLTYTRPVGDLRVGILTIAEKWKRYLNLKPSFITRNYLSGKYALQVSDDNFMINGSVLPDGALLEKVLNLNLQEGLVHHDELIAARINRAEFEDFVNGIHFHGIKKYDISELSVRRIKRPYDIFSNNGDEIAQDFTLITKGRTSAPIPESNKVIGAEHIFLEEGAKVEMSILNASKGPIYIGAGAEIMEGSIVRGALAMQDHAVLKLGSKVYGPTTLGPYCKVGGEVNNVVFQGYSNKGHDGFLGNAVIGEWCNIGADTNSSNLKNNYAEVKLWSYESNRFEKTGLQFCGLIMGDHAKCGINTMFNTGTVVGVGANVFGSGFPRNFIPSFAWGGAHGFTTYKIDKMIETAKIVMARRHKELNAIDEAILNHIFNQTNEYRHWERSAS